MHGFIVEHVLGECHVLIEFPRVGLYNKVCWIAGHLLRTHLWRSAASKLEILCPNCFSFIFSTEAHQQFLGYLMFRWQVFFFFLPLDNPATVQKVLVCMGCCILRALFVASHAPVSDTFLVELAISFSRFVYLLWRWDMHSFIAFLDCLNHGMRNRLALGSFSEKASSPDST